MPSSGNLKSGGSLLCINTPPPLQENIIALPPGVQLGQFTPLNDIKSIPIIFKRESPPDSAGLLIKPQVDWIRSICCSPLPIARPISLIHIFEQRGLQILHIDFLPTGHPSHGFGTTMNAGKFSYLTCN